MFFYKVGFSRKATKWAYLKVSKFDFCHIVSVPPRGVELNNCPQGDQTLAKLVKILDVYILGNKAFMKNWAPCNYKKCFMKHP